MTQLVRYLTLPDRADCPDNYIVSMRFTVQTIIWSQEFVIHKSLEQGTTEKKSNDFEMTSPEKAQQIRVVLGMVRSPKIQKNQALIFKNQSAYQVKQEIKSGAAELFITVSEKREVTLTI